MSTFSSVKSTFSEEIVVQKYATTSATKSFGLPLIVDQLFVKKFEQKTSIDVVLIVISCDANKCFEKRFSISTRDSDEEII